MYWAIPGLSVIPARCLWRRYTLVFQSHGIEVLHMGGIDGGMNVIPDYISGKEIDEDDEVPPDMVDREFRPVAAP